MMPSETHTFVDPVLVGFSSLSSDLPRGILLGKMFGLADFLITRDESAFAVCIDDGPLTFEAFGGEGKNDRFMGTHVSGIELQADLESAFTYHQTYVSPGDMVIEKGVVFVAAKAIQTGHSPRLIRWDDATQLGQGSFTGGFRRWQVIRREPSGLIRVLKSVGD